MKAYPFAFGIPLACGAIVVACAQNPPPQEPGVANPQPLAATDAAVQVATATCKHATACNEIGVDRNYASPRACMDKNRGEAENDFRQANCPHGVNQTRLEACLNAIQSEACSGIGSGLQRQIACKTGTLCP